ncbi:MAG: bifunctional diaminohydroxyphosphoribosylaminopyrimidine deaminase/5-amino-6-(5-phosphoribosylamino)uracil reductase RibD [Endomicrobium sp.]|jgi:diaminohydroxyphosphoribosylaminopyrimidine deaminase/5-amino-6-(5-phosphoribosylamino)uracil reductase|nr:bifunctional diaminohydroxyphosphoribosylaminopyrimidine deaminase/5-amino-6-(5-phosphoribosylamino)uracil reductase RibD [Endomicrobium sp.]
MEKQKQYMRQAIVLAKKGKSKVFPNPMVGCVIVKDGKIVGRGFHQYFGGNHAEANAVLDAGEKAKGADLYVTLEPCNSYGKKPPCAKTIIEAGIKRVFFAQKDPNVLNSHKTLEKYGVKVYGGFLGKEAAFLIKDYLKHLKTKSKVSVKAAMTLDGKIASCANDSKWITSQKARSCVHKLRTKYDAVLVGFNTALKDNPLLTSHGAGKNPIRVVIDPERKLPKNYHIFDGSAPTIIICQAGYAHQGDGCIDTKRVDSSVPLPRLTYAALDIEEAKKDFNVIIRKLSDLSIKTILIEGGGSVISSALFSKCVDDIYLFAAPKIIGGQNAVSVVGGKGADKMADAIKVKNLKVKKIGADFLFTGKIK